MPVALEGEVLSENVANIIQLQHDEERLVGDLEENRWEQARLIVAELDAGKSQRQLAREIGKRSHTHVQHMARAWRRFGNLGCHDRPPFNVAYHDRSKRRELPEPEAPKPEPTPDVPEPVRDPRRALTTEQESEVVAAYRKGATTGDLAREYGVSTSTITKVTREAGITTKNVGHKYGPGGLLGKLTTDWSAQVFAFDTLIEQEFYGASPEDMERASEALAELAKQARRLSRKLKEESAR